MIALLTASLFFEILVHVLNCISKTRAKTLERQHCRAARIIFGFPPDMPTVDVLATVKWNALNV